MIAEDYHVHTTFSDGENTMEEMVIAAIEKKMTAIGFSDHSYTFFDRSYCIGADNIPRYFREAARLREKYGDKIHIFPGVEQDFYSRRSTKPYDYAIGSVHYLKVGDRYFPVDESPEDFATMIAAFGGDAYAACEAYFKTVKRYAKRRDIKLIGHFDLISVFNGDGTFFDEQNARYLASAKDAARALVAAGKIFEINTRAYYKGRRREPYPSSAIRDFIDSIGGRFILSSDSHKKEELLCRFAEFESVVPLKKEFL